MTSGCQSRLSVVGRRQRLSYHETVPPSETTIEYRGGTIVVQIPDESAPPHPVRFSEWQSAPPPDTDFLRRVGRLRWEKGLGAAAIAVVWVAYFWLFVGFGPFHGGGGFIGTLGLLTSAVWMNVRSRRAAPHVADLLDLPATCAQYPVELRYAVDNVTYGSDEGILSFVDGWMHFQGRRTSWSLAAKGTSLSPLGSSAHTKKQRTDYGRRVNWSDGKSMYSIQLLPMDGLDGLGSGLRKKCHVTLEEWKNSASVASANVTVPPIQVLPEVVDRLGRNLRFCWIVGSVLSGALLLKAVGLAGTWNSLIVWVAMIAAALTVGCGYWLTYRLSTIWPRCANPDLLNRPRKQPGWKSRALFWARTRWLGWKYRGTWSELDAVRPEADPLRTVPVEVRYESPMYEYRREIGWLTLAEGWVRFDGRHGSWSMSSREVVYRDEAERNWRACFEEPIPFEHVLEWKQGGATSLVRVVPLDTLGGDPSGARLRGLFREFETCSRPLVADPVWPPSEPELGRVPRLQLERTLWSVAKVTCHAMWIGALVWFFAFFPTAWVAASLVGAAGVLGAFAVQRRRSAVENKIASTYLSLERQKGASWKLGMRQ